MNKKNLKVIFLMGPTASGKTDLAISLKDKIPIEIISVDSGAIYKKMDIGTSKPSLKQISQIPYYLIDIIDPKEKYSISNFFRDALFYIKKIHESGKIPLLVGGSMLYYKALLYGITPLPSQNPQIREYIKNLFLKKGPSFLHYVLSKIDYCSSQRIHKNDFQRVSRALEVFFITGKSLTELQKKSHRYILKYKTIQFAIIPKNKNELKIKIKNRFKNMLKLGFEKECRNLFERKDLNEYLPSMRCVGYRQMWKYFSKKITYSDMIDESIYATQKLAKHQMTWLNNWKNVFYLYNENLKLAKKNFLKIFDKKYI